ATYVAAAINVAVALISYALASRAGYSPAAERASAEAAPPAGAKSVYLAIALSGMTALGAEIIWTRLLSVMIGATVYTFSIILAVFLVGLGLGSWIGSALASSRQRAS